MSILTKQNVLLAKLESTYNTDSTPAAANDAILVQNFNPGFTGQKMVEQPNVSKGTFGPDMSIYAGSLFQFSFEMLAKGSGAAGTAPELGVPLQCCAMTETVVASTSVTYAPESDNSVHKSATFYFYEGGKLYKVTGCRGTYTVNAAAGDAIKFAFTMTGHLSAYSDTSIVSPTLDSTKPLVFNGVGFTIDSYAASISALTFDIGNSVNMPADVNGSDGYGEIVIPDRKPVGNIDPLDVAKATKDWISLWQTDSALALTTGAIGSAGNQLTISMPAVRPTDAGFGNREDLRSFDMPFEALESAGDDNVSYIFT